MGRGHAGHQEYEKDREGVSAIVSVWCSQASLLGYTPYRPGRGTSQTRLSARHAGPFEMLHSFGDSHKGAQEPGSPFLAEVASGG